MGWGMLRISGRFCKDMHPMYIRNVRFYHRIVAVINVLDIPRLYLPACEP